MSPLLADARCRKESIYEMTPGFWDKLNEVHGRVSTGDPESWRERYSALSPLDQELFDINYFVNECTIGSIASYFESRAAVHWARTMDALARIGADDACALLREASALFPGGRPPEDATVLADVLRDTQLRANLENLMSRFDDGEILDKLKAHWEREVERR